jgi:hypothetical protein
MYMTNRTRIRLFAAALAVVIAVAGFHPVHADQHDSLAHQARKNHDEANSAQQLSEAEVEAYRAEFKATADVFFELATMTGNEYTQKIMARSLEQIDAVSAESLEVFIRNGVDMPGLLQAAGTLRDMLNERMDDSTDFGSGRTKLTPGFPDAQYSSLCGSVRNDTEVLFAARLTYEVAQGIWSAASRACDEVIVVLGEGGNLSLACIPVDVVLFAARVTLDELANCDGDIDSAETEGTYERSAHLHDDVTMVDGKVDVLDGKVDIVDAKVDVLDGKMDNLAAAIEELRVVNCEIIRLLHTPQGQRTSSCPVCSDQPEYPYDWN